MFVVRLDGLDPMEIWSTGPGPGHSTIAVWGEDKVLYKAKIKKKYNLKKI